MFYKLSKIFLYISLLTPLLLIKSMYFPFIAGKAMFFRGAIELSLLFLLLHVLANLQHHDFVQALLKKLRHPFVLCIAVFAVAITITALLGVTPTQSFWSNFERGDGAFQILHYALFFVLSFLLFTEKKSLEYLLLVNIAISIPMSLYALSQLIGSSSNPFIVAPGARVSGTLGNPSYLAAYLIFTLIFIAYFLIERREYIKHYVTLLLATPAIGGFIIFLGVRDWGRGGEGANAVLNKFMGWSVLWYIVAAVVLYLLSTIDKKWFQTISLSGVFLFTTFILLKTGTRGAFLALIAGMLIIAAINFFLTKNKRVRLGLGICFALIIGLSGLFFATHKADIWKNIPVLNRLVNFTSATTDIQPRIWTWGSALSATIERPLLGWGVEGFSTPFDKYYNPKHYGIESFFDRTHNIFLEYSVSGGLLVLLPWLAIFYFYYRGLMRRKKDVWYSILFAAPVMYLVQGFFLFDTLPIYLAFFVFLVFFANTAGEETGLNKHPSANLRGINLVTAGLLVIGLLMLMRQTLMLPFQKNMVLVDALIAQGDLAARAGTEQAIAPMLVIEKFRTALTTPSPIGQEETIGSYQKFVLSLLENAAQNPTLAKDPQVRKEVKEITDEANRWFDENKSIFPGLKEGYINGGLNLRAGLSFSQPSLLARGKEQFQKAIEIAPTRLEFIAVLIQIAKAEGDQAELEKWTERAALYRPDLFSPVPAKP